MSTVAYYRLRDKTWGIRVDAPPSDPIAAVGDVFTVTANSNGRTSVVQTTEQVATWVDAATGLRGTLFRFVDVKVANQTRAPQASAPAQRSRGKGNGRINGPSPARGPIVFSTVTGASVFVVAVPWVTETEPFRTAIKVIQGCQYGGPKPPEQGDTDPIGMWSVPSGEADRVRTIISALHPGAPIHDVTPPPAAAPPPPASHTATKEPPETWARRVLNMAAGVPLTPETIKAAYKVAVSKAHPDRGGSQEAFVEVQAAKQTLTGLCPKASAVAA
jgi:hypothetical protein